MLSIRFIPAGNW